MPYYGMPPRGFLQQKSHHYARTGPWEISILGSRGVHSVAFSPDGKRPATGDGAGAEALKLWDTDSWQNVVTLQGSSSVYYQSLFSPDGNSVGTLSYAGILNVWRAPSWDEINTAEAKDKTDGP